MIRQAINSDAPEPAAIARAVEILRLGGVVAFPTDTLYGLAVDPRSAIAVATLFTIKGRDAQVALPLIAADVQQAETIGELGDIERRLAAAFWPGPLTLVLPARHELTPAALGGGDTVAVRVPAHGVARALARAFGFAITATSANLSGASATADPDAVHAAFGDRLDLLFDAGLAPGGPPSTIVRIDRGRPTLVRAGAIAWERVLESLQ
jgi:L-threonylcarbamoyladenylate synthase